ncbi:hypothetical protein lerEdw1_019424, partial [Lerista edwardsae]
MLTLRGGGCHAKGRLLLLLLRPRLGSSAQQLEVKKPPWPCCPASPPSCPPDIDPTKAPIAFGRRGLPKLNEELEDAKLLTRQRALMALCDLVHDPENVYTAIGLGFLENLKKLLLDEDSTVRRKTTEVLYIMATHSVGRTAFLEHGVIPALAQLLDDPVDICRWNMHYALKLMSELPS